MRVAAPVWDLVDVQDQGNEEGDRERQDERLPGQGAEPGPTSEKAFLRMSADVCECREIVGTLWARGSANSY